MSLEVSVTIIAICLVVLSLSLFLAAMVGVVFAMRLISALKHVELLLDDIRREVVPLIAQTRGVVEEVHDVSRIVRQEVTRSQYIMGDTIRGVMDLSVRTRELFGTLSNALSAVGKLATFFASRRKGA